jgi:hypothetical protein
MNAAIVGEGGSDRALSPIIRWLLSEVTDAEVELAWVDLARLSAGHKLRDKVQQALIAQRCDVLFIHRDADNQDPSLRRDEIRHAAQGHPYVAVVPVRMTEAWLLIDERAIRSAAGRPSSRDDLSLTSVVSLEALADPKTKLRDALMLAHGATGRRRHQFDPRSAVHRVADLVEDWSPLRQLSAFRQLEADTRIAVAALGLPLRP